MRKQCIAIAILILGVLRSGDAFATTEVCGNDLDDDGDGLVDNNCYSTQSTGVCENPLGCGTTGMVSWSTGSLNYALPPDVSFKSAFGPQVLRFSRFYTSQYAPGSTPTTVNHTPLGARWQHSFLTFLHKSGSTVIVHTVDGRDVLFNYSSNDGTYDLYTPQTGYHVLHLRQKTSTSVWDLQTLTGQTLVYNSSGQLNEVWDNLGSTPNKAFVTWDSTSNGNVAFVSDANGFDRLKFNYTSGLLTSIELQHGVMGISTITWTTNHTTTYGYTSGALTSVTIGSQLAQQMVYTSSYLTQIQDGGGNRIAGFAYSSTAAGQVDRIDTSRGTLGFEFGATRSGCSGTNKSVLYFNKGNASSCSIDSDCGSGYLCGGKTGSGSTGTCFLAARCLTLTASSYGNEQLISTVTPIGPGGGTCTGACTDVAAYVWGLAGNSLDALGVKDPLNNYISKTYNSNGLPTSIAYGDTDSDPTNGGYARIVYMFYDSTYPGRIAEVRRKSDLDSGVNQQTQYVYNATTHLLDKISQIGMTYDSTGAPTRYQYDTLMSYTSRGQLQEVDGPVSGAKAVYDYSSSQPFQLVDAKRYYDSTHFLQRSFASYDLFGNPTAITEEDGSMTCLTYSSDRNVLTQHRHAMAGQTNCLTTNALDITTNWTRDSALRLTQLQRPDLSCIHYSYNSSGQLSMTKRRDDCTPASSGDYESYVYSADGLLTEIDTYDASSTMTRKQPYTYFASRRLQQIVNPVDTSKFTGLVYDDRGLLTEVDGGGSLTKSTFSLDSDGRVTAVNKYTASSTYDSWSLTYAFEGGQRSYTDGDSKTTDSVRDDLGRVVKLQSPDMNSTGGAGPYPTLQFFDEAGHLTTVVEAKGSGTLVAERTHQFTFDKLGRPLTSDYRVGASDGQCQSGSPPEIQRYYDSYPVSCPSGVSCSTATVVGRLAYMKVSLMCDSSSDHSLDQETFFIYDAGGRVVEEYVRDDSGRIADHLYEWTKNGELSKVTTPSGAVLGASFGSGSSNSNTDRVTALWRTNTSTPVIDNILWFPYGGLQQYNRFDTSGGDAYRTKITRNLAYRVVTVEDEKQVDGSNAHYVGITEDADGRVIARDYYPSDPTIAGRYDSYYLYDYQNHVVCETKSSVSSCPTSGSNIKNSHSSSPPFTHAGDWKTLLRTIPGSTGLTHTFTDATGTHQISSVNQSDGTPTLGTTAYSYNAHGSRLSDDNTSGLSHDGRTYAYDARGNVSNVRGEYYTGSAWHFYDVASAFDGKNRRVFKSFYDETSTKMATWFFYYDVLDRLVEVRYTPDTSSSTTYSLFQLFWLEDRLVLYWQTDYPSATTSKRYVGTDETGRPIDMYSWPSSGNHTRVWTVNPDAWGEDNVLVGPTVYQPILFAGQYKDDETVALMDDHATVHRPGVVLNGFRTYDPFVGAYLQIDPSVDATRSSYIYVESNAVGRSDPLGSEVSAAQPSGQSYSTLVGPRLGPLPIPRRRVIKASVDFFNFAKVCPEATANPSDFPPPAPPAFANETFVLNPPNPAGPRFVVGELNGIQAPDCRTVFVSFLPEEVTCDTGCIGAGNQGNLVCSVTKGPHEGFIFAPGEFGVAVAGVHGGDTFTESDCTCGCNDADCCNPGGLPPMAE